jgi:membrane protein implicated in regulation of membrane protease activity
MIFSILPKQPPVIVSYIRVGKLLYYSLLLFILEAWFYWTKLTAAYIEASMLFIVFWLACFLFAFVHIFLVAMDGWSRFQNYKRAKDQFYMHGFNRRIADTYIGSKCQRTAAIVAAEELGIGETVKAYYATKGVKWYHWIPYFMVKDPLFFFNKKFWSRSFLEKNYKPKFDYNKLQSASATALQFQL